MFLTKVKIAVVVLLAAGTAGAGTWGLSYPRLAAGQPPRPAKALPPAPGPGLEGKAGPPAAPPEDEGLPKLPMMEDAKGKALLEVYPATNKLRALLKDRLAAARDEVNGRWEQYVAGRGTLDVFTAASLRLLEAEKELSDRKADQVAALEYHWRRMKEIEKVVTAQYEAGRASLTDWSEAKFFRLQAEIGLERAKDK